GKSSEYFDQIFYENWCHVGSILSFSAYSPATYVAGEKSVTSSPIYCSDRLLIPLFPVNAICPVCCKACLDSFEEHAVHCKKLPGFKYRHNMVRDVLFDICRRVGISAKQEAPVNFLTVPSDGRSTLRPADVLVFGWVGGKHACVDLMVVSHIVGLYSGVKEYISISDSWGWKKLLQIRDEVAKNIWYKLGNGKSTSVWFDNWCNLGPLFKIISNRNLYSAGLLRNLMVANMVSNDKWKWPNEWKNKDNNECKFSTREVYKDMRNKDNNECKFSTREVYKDMRIQSSQIKWTKLVWNAESHDHLFFNCLFTGAIWSRLKEMMQVQSNTAGWNNIIDEFVDMPNKSSVWSIVGYTQGCVFLALVMPTEVSLNQVSDDEDANLCLATSLWEM
ncbi:hypothetical protein Tco_0572621, partial [Tanacetum coccineum]